MSDLTARDAAVFLHQSSSTPVHWDIARAEGTWIEDHAGRRWMDFHGNSAHHLGHGHPAVIAAIKAQLGTLPFAPRRFTSEPAVHLAEALSALSPIPGARVLFAPSGSDAVDMALRLARAHTGRPGTLAFTAFLLDVPQPAVVTMQGTTAPHVSARNNRKKEGGMYIRH